MGWLSSLIGDVVSIGKGVTSGAGDMLGLESKGPSLQSQLNTEKKELKDKQTDTANIINTMDSLQKNVTTRALNDVANSAVDTTITNLNQINDMKDLVNSYNTQFNNELSELSDLVKQINDLSNQLGVYTTETNILYKASEIKKKRLKQLRVCLLVLGVVFVLVVIHYFMGKKGVSYKSPTSAPASAPASSAASAPASAPISA